MKTNIILLTSLLLLMNAGLFISCNKNNDDGPLAENGYDPVQVSGNIEAPEGMQIDYTSLTINGGAISTALPAATGDFNIDLNKNTTQLVSAIQANGNPILLNIAINPESLSNIKLDAYTTACSMIFLNPGVVVSEPTMSNTILGLIKQLPETNSLAIIIAKKLKTNSNILLEDDAEINSALSAAIKKLMLKIEDLSANSFLNKSMQIDQYREMKHLAEPSVFSKHSSSIAIGDLTISPSGVQSGLTVTAIKQSENKYEIQVKNSKKRYVNAFLDLPTGANIGSAFLSSRKSILDFQPLEPATEKISAILDISDNPTSILYAYSFGALKYEELKNAPNWKERTIKPVIYTAVNDFFFPLLDVISGVKNFRDSSPGSDPIGVSAFIITEMNKDVSLRGQLIIAIETGDFSGGLSTAIKAAMQICIQNPTLITQYLKGRAVGMALVKVLASSAVMPLRVALIGASSIDFASTLYDFGTCALLERWTISTAQGYEGTWNGTFYYTASIPQESGPPKIVNDSFSLTIDLESLVSVPGEPQILTVTSATSSDPVFGATSPVVPVVPINIASLPANFGSLSQVGMGFLIQFPNGSHILTNNSVDGSFNVDDNGQVISSSDQVSYAAFVAGNIDLDANMPGSGPGGYAYTWCTFTGWSLTRQP